jgi:hypothetical protein
VSGGAAFYFSIDENNLLCCNNDVARQDLFVRKWRMRTAFSIGEL